jgi:hypothetical protein
MEVYKIERLLVREQLPLNVFCSTETDGAASSQGRGPKGKGLGGNIQSPRPSGDVCCLSRRNRSGYRKRGPQRHKLTSSIHSLDLVQPSIGPSTDCDLIILLNQNRKGERGPKIDIVITVGISPIAAASSEKIDGGELNGPTTQIEVDDCVGHLLILSPTGHAADLCDGLLLM